MSSEKGDPDPPGDKAESEPPIIITGGGGAQPSSSADSEVQTSRSADIKPPTATDSETTVDADPPIIISGGGGQ